MSVSKNKKRVQISLGKSTMEKLELYAAHETLSKSVVIELALIQYLERKNQETTN